MSTRFKVLQGTRSAHAARLCDTCHHGVVRKGAADSDEQIHCTVTGRRVRTRIVECSQYSNRTRPSLWDLRQIAWVLNMDSKRQRIGFVRAQQWEKEHEDEELLPTHMA